MRALGDDFEVDEAMLRDAILLGECANIFYLPFVMKIDLFGHAHGPFDESEFDRRRQIRLASAACSSDSSPTSSCCQSLA